MVMSPAGIWTENDCAGVDQPHFTRPTDRRKDQQQFTGLSWTGRNLSSDWGQFFYGFQPSRCPLPFHLKTETGTISKTFSLEYRTMGIVQNLSNSKQHIVVCCMSLARLSLKMYLLKGTISVTLLRTQRKFSSFVIQAFVLLTSAVFLSSFTYNRIMLRGRYLTSSLTNNTYK
jgi:hypothetical protein